MGGGEESARSHSNSLKAASVGSPHPPEAAPTAPSPKPLPRTSVHYPSHRLLWLWTETTETPEQWAPDWPWRS